MCGYFCIGFIDFMIIGKISYIIQIYFLLTNMKGMIKNNTKTSSITKKVEIEKLHCIICSKCRKFQKPKISYIFEKALVFSIICSK